MAYNNPNLPSSLRSIDPGTRMGDLPALANAVATRQGMNGQDTITASTTQTQAGGRGKLAFGMNVVTSANGSDAVTMPKSIAGASLVIVNTTGQTIQLFPETGDAINAAGANNAVTVANVTTSNYYCITAGQWWGGATTNES